MSDYPTVSPVLYNPVTENLQKLAALFPAAVKDGELDIEALREELGVFQEIQPGDEKYELGWAGKQAAKKKAFEPLLGKTLKFRPEDSKHPETTGNLYIEGDNLEALKLLRQNYYGEINMIYIDPPYNTGKDFVYNDKFTMSRTESELIEGSISEAGERLVKNEKTSNRFHARWLDMMYPRLRLAKDLLKNDGAIFISIDSEESANLRKLCDEVFGEDNFINELVWVKATKPLNTSNSGFSRNTESILVYGRQTQLAIKHLPLTNKHADTYKNPDNDDRGAWTKVPMFLRTNSNKPKSLRTPWDGQQRTEKWFCSQTTLDELYQENRIIVTADSSG